MGKGKQENKKRKAVPWVTVDHDAVESLPLGALRGAFADFHRIVVLIVYKGCVSNIKDAAVQTQRGATRRAGGSSPARTTSLGRGWGTSTFLAGVFDAPKDNARVSFRCVSRSTYAPMIDPHGAISLTYVESTNFYCYRPGENGQTEERMCECRRNCRG